MRERLASLHDKRRRLEEQACGDATSPPACNGFNSLTRLACSPRLLYLAYFTTCSGGLARYGRNGYWKQ
eukprot:231672-Pleurochrysis_carterae.AAC.2